VGGDLKSKPMSASRSIIIVDSRHDNVAVACRDLAAGDMVAGIVLLEPIKKAQRFALYELPRGSNVVQYGNSFGISKGIKAGALISSFNTKNIEIVLNSSFVPHPPKTVFDPKLVSRKFNGFRRSNGGIGTRNYYLVIPTSQCASATAVQIAAEATRQFRSSKHASGIDGFVAIPNTEGCGCASNFQIDRVLRVFRNFMMHPNVGGVLIVDLGCEQTNRKAVYGYLNKEKSRISAPVDWLTIQEEGGTGGTVKKAMKVMAGRLKEVARIRRTSCPIGAITVGTECGASDSFSGITANPVIVNAVDRVIRGKGCGILSEVPEMVGAENVLMERMRNRRVVKDFIGMMQWYHDLAKIYHVDMSDNLVPENRVGGLINPCIKSLGAITKGGTSRIEHILDYGERIKGRGLHLMQGPGNDLESVTGLVSSGANIICFSTGKGTVTGSAIVPVIKVSSTTVLFERMKTDIDLDAGVLISRMDASVDGCGEALLERIIDVCSGARTKSENNYQAQFQIWTAGKFSL
jgi:Altronate dehydratase